MAARSWAFLAVSAPASSSGEWNSVPLTATVALNLGVWDGPSRWTVYVGGAHRRCWHSSCSRDLNILSLGEFLGAAGALAPLLAG
jgi:hypothetical protein